MTLFEDMTDENKMMHHDSRSKKTSVMYARLEESHLFVQYPSKFASIERWERG